MLLDLCPSTNTNNNTKTPNKYMPPLLKFSPAPTHPQQYSTRAIPTCMHSDPATTPGFGWIQDSVESCIQCGYSWIQDTAGYAAFSCVLRSAAFSLDTGLRSAAFRNLRSAAFCVQLRSAFSCVLRSAFSCVLRSAAFCVQLRSGICVQLRSAFSCVRVQLRSA